VSGNLSWTTGAYAYDGAGNIKAIGTTLEPNSDGRTNTFVYDRVGRLTQGPANYQVNGYSQSYTYDAVGNMTSMTTTTPGGTVPISIPITGSTNRLTNSTYDAGGNEIYDPASTSSRRFDALNMMTKKYPAAGEDYYIYTPDDQRIGVHNGGLWTWTLRDESGQMLRQYSGSDMYPRLDWLWIEDYVYRGGQLLAADRVPQVGGRRHFHLDHLGTPRLVTGPGGALMARHDYLPFGREVTPNNTELTTGFYRIDPVHFTGHERDYNDSSADSTDYLDYMHARYYNGNVGRFLSVDPNLNASKSMAAPQRWNRYVYADNSPVRHLDLDGRQSFEFAQDRDVADLVSHKITTAEYNARANARAAGAGAGALLWGAAYATAQAPELLGIAYRANPRLFLATMQFLGGVAGFLSPRSNVTMTGISNPICGDFERVISTKAGDVSVLANASTKGTVLTLTDVAIYGTDKTIRAGEAGAGAFKAAVTSLAAEAKAQGYTQIILQGLRYSGATKDTDKAVRDIVINLVEKAQ
jgi:RHS repeat-associated protein